MITVTIHTDSAAFEHDPGGEVARILRVAADKADVETREMKIFLDHMRDMPFFDANGNRVGTVTVE